MTYTSIAQIKQANASIGHHFFDHSSLRFFRSRIGKTVYGGRYFVTSEQFVGSDGRAWPREYTVRVASDDGSINTVGDFQKYASNAQAVAAIKRLLAEQS